MGYRNYIASITKEEYDKIKNFTREELYKYKDEPLDDIGYVGVYDVAKTKLYELGKYVDQFDECFFEPVFLNTELQKEMEEEHDFYVVKKEFLAEVIDVYYKKTKDYYSDMLKPLMTDEKFPELKDPVEFDFKDVTRIVEHIRSNSFEWGCPPFGYAPPYNLDSGDAVTNSCKYEYAQFELVRIYKTFDWDNDIMVYYGY